MKLSNQLKSILVYLVSILLAYFSALWLGEYLNDGGFLVNSGGFMATVMLPYTFLFFVTFISSLWFIKLNKWFYLVPAILIILFMGFLGYLSNNLLLVIEYWLIAFTGGWVLAWIVNFVAGIVRK